MPSAKRPGTHSLQSVCRVMLLNFPVPQSLWVQKAQRISNTRVKDQQPDLQTERPGCAEKRPLMQSVHPVPSSNVPKQAATNNEKLSVETMLARKNLKGTESRKQSLGPRTVLRFSGRLAQAGPCSCWTAGCRSVCFAVSQGRAALGSSD
jgi:hypothetical protein